ncbi:MULTISPECIES: AAA family ATPase [unclassified Nonomuraea]|uniref:AAA family ATPase n=1 Tax=unclassified Nonomuraea TaxID=2593643 RepID=UPI0033C00DB8
MCLTSTAAHSRQEQTLTIKRRLPTITRVVLRNFSLYANQEIVDVDMGGGVFCLAGANGLGKSSFLAAINYCLTGVVAEPDRSFLGVKDYYEASLDYCKKYFDGRIADVDRSSAEVCVTFRLSSKSYTVARSFFAPKELRELQIIDSGDQILVHETASEEDSEKARALHARYEAELVQDCNLGDFSQFAFMQHFVFTFDERRHLLFWDSAAADPALYLAFGMNGNESIEANDLRRKIAKAESNARNAQWQATQARNRLRDLGIDATPGEEAEDLVELHQSLSQKASQKDTALATAEQAAEDAEIAYAEASARLQDIRTKYDRAFAQRVGERHDPRFHPMVQSVLRESACEVCGSRDDGIVARLEAKLSSRSCPFCDTSLDDLGNDSTLKELKDLDSQLMRAQEELRELSQRVDRLRGELRVAKAEKEAAAEELAQFEATHQGRLPGVALGSDTLAARRSHLLAEKADAERRRNNHRKLRDTYRTQLRPLQKKLREAYMEGEMEFVPLFRQLARQFIGIDLDIFLDKERDDFKLGLEVDGQRRRSTVQLSESQRFFLDIALRMALAQYMSDDSSKATLLIDTPEGSLDIAYEARAGGMFADFVGNGYHIVMTANINASQLLQRLAARCGRDRMQLVRMTDWTPLSEVQAEGEELFDRAYARIEELLEEAVSEDILGEEDSTDGFEEDPDYDDMRD